MNTDCPRITVLMAVYNGMPYLPKAIESILDQTYADFEFLIVNDCSTDETRDVVLGYGDPRIRLIDNEQNLKQTRSLNKGLEYVSSEFVARMDDDDVSHRDRLERQVDFLQQHPDVAAVGSNLQFIDQNGVECGDWTYPQNDLALRWMSLFACPISNGAVMFRKEIIWDQLGGYDPSIIVAQDWELWSRVLEKGNIANLPDILVDIRRHPNQVTAVSEETAQQDARRICAANARCVLGLEEVSEGYAQRLEILSYYTARHLRRQHPEQFVDMLEDVSGKFVKRYPGAKDNQEIKDYTNQQYFEAVEVAGLRHWSVACKAWRSVWRSAPKKVLLYRIARWPLMGLGGGWLMSWLSKKHSLYAALYRVHSLLNKGGCQSAKRS